MLRATSVSSMRSTSVPPKWRAKAQLNKAVRTFPMWSEPVGDGANRSRTWLGSRSPSTSGLRQSRDTTLFVRVPRPSMVTETSSPGSIGPTPAGVPVSMTSPGNKVMNDVM